MNDISLPMNNVEKKYTVKIVSAILMYGRNAISDCNDNMWWNDIIDGFCYLSWRDVPLKRGVYSFG